MTVYDGAATGASIATQSPPRVDRYQTSHSGGDMQARKVRRKVERIGNRESYLVQARGFREKAERVEHRVWVVSRQAHLWNIVAGSRPVSEAVPSFSLSGGIGSAARTAK